MSISIGSRLFSISNFNFTLGNNRKVFLFLLVILLTSSFSFYQEKSLLEEADYWYSQRSKSYNGHKVDQKNINKAIQLYSLILQNSQSPYTNERLLASYHFKISYVDLEEREMRLLTEKAKSIGESAIREYPQSAPIMYWQASILSKWAEYHGILSSNREDIPKHIKNLSERVIKLAPEFRWRGGYRVLGLLHCMTPKIPFLFEWVSKDLSLQCLEKAAKEKPEHLGNLLGLAKIYKKKNRKKESVLLLHKISETPPREELLMEDLMIIHRANKMLNESYNCEICFKHIKS